ncbi:MAG: ABC transporter permease [Deltaproteobacteria bacterium]|jgi:ABC-type multidrug transport system ATPase subunit|nr:ABC transporter permease [Deltaproteobacteria bacterium]MBT4266067.1 ABC transporter permease [Deltaproteobacteria bacterium]MBT6498905.1 ABC transporter permease [Deltaproteobacteria bacterium]
MPKSDLLQEFFLVADPDQRNMLIDVLRELMSNQADINDEEIALFTELVKGRGNICLASQKQGFREKNVISIGATEENDLVVPSLVQPRQRIRIELDGDTFNISASGQLFFYVKGKKYQTYRGKDAFIEFTLRNFRVFLFSKTRLIFFEESPEHYLTLHEYEVFVPDKVGWNPFSSKKKKILQDLCAGFRTGEYVGIFGPTGSGKSTLLLSLLNRYETRGNVWIDGISFREYYNDHFYEVGFVPQDDILHRDLTIYETLHYSISLRGIERDSDRVKQLIEQTIKQLDLEKAANVIVGDEQQKGISGGQRKRVNLALELLSENIYLLMLDEPTSGLDPSTERHILQLLRNLASQGLLVLMVSHSLYEATMAMLDLALILTEQGEIAYYGPAAEAKYYFQVDSPQEIFDLLKQQTSSYWVKKYRQIENDTYRKYTLTRLKLNQIRVNEDARSDNGKPVITEKRIGENRTSMSPTSAKGPLEQFMVFTKRLFRRQTRDKQSLFSRALQAVLLALVLRIAYVAVESGLLTLLSIVPVWLGATMSIRSINAELPIFFREYRYQLGIFSYVLSIFFANAIFIFIQILIFAIVLYLLLPLQIFGFGFFQVLMIIYLTSLVGISIGMTLSAIFSSQQAAVNALPLFLVFMILFGGSVIHLKDMGKVSYWLSNMTPTRWALEGLLYEGKYLATSIPQVTSWEKVGRVSDVLQKKLDDEKLFPFEIQAPQWEELPHTYILKTAGIQPPMAGNAMRLMGIYRQPLSDCTLDNFDACPAALAHKYTIQMILLVQIIILMGGCIGIMFLKTRSQK